MFDDHQEEESFPAISGLGARLAERLGKTKPSKPAANGVTAREEVKPPEEVKSSDASMTSAEVEPAEEISPPARAGLPQETKLSEGTNLSSGAEVSAETRPFEEVNLAAAAETAEEERLADTARLAEIQRRQREIQEQILDQKTGKAVSNDNTDRIGSVLEAAAYGSFLTDTPSRAPSFGASLAMHCSIVVLYLVLSPYLPHFAPATIEPAADDATAEKLVIRIPASLYAKQSQLQALNAPPAPTVEGGGGSGHEGGSPSPASTSEPKLTAEPAPAAKAETASEPAPKAPEPAPEPPAPPARFEMATQVPRVPGKQTLLQTGSSPDVPIQESVQLPNIMFSSANAQEIRKPIPQKFVMPGRKVEKVPELTQNLPSQAPPDLELKPSPDADQMGIVTQPTVAAVPKPIPQKFNLPTHRQPPPPGKNTALSASDGESIRLLSLSNQPAPVSEFLVIPGGNQIGDIVPDTSSGTAFGTGSVGGTKGGTGRTAAGDPKGAESGRGTTAGGSTDGTANGAGRGGSGTGGGAGAGGVGTGLGSGTGDGNGRGTGTGPGSGSGTGTSLASGSGPGNGPGTGGGNGGGGDGPNGGITVFGGEVPAGMRGGTGSVQLGEEVATEMARPQLGSFDVVVVQTSAADALPESAGMLSGQPIYTVYLEIGLPKDWILQYCLATINGGAQQDETIVSLGNPAPVKAPFPMRTKIPQELDDHHSGLIMLHGFLDARGRFKQLEWVTGGSNYLGQILIAALRDWEFRPATRDGRAVEIEIVLAIPGKVA